MIMKMKMKKGVGGFYLGDLSSYTGDVYVCVSQLF